MSIHVKPDGKYQVNFSTGQRKPDGAMVRWFKTCKTMKAAKAQGAGIGRTPRPPGRYSPALKPSGPGLTNGTAATVKGQKAQRTQEHYRDIIDRKISAGVGRYGVGEG